VRPSSVLHRYASAPFLKHPAWCVPCSGQYVCMVAASSLRWLLVAYGRIAHTLTFVAQVESFQHADASRGTGSSSSKGWSQPNSTPLYDLPSWLASNPLTSRYDTRPKRCAWPARGGVGRSVERSRFLRRRSLAWCPVPVWVNGAVHGVRIVSWYQLQLSGRCCFTASSGITHRLLPQ
jgi:hypothetical protein